MRLFGGSVVNKTWATWTTIKGNAVSSNSDTLYFYGTPSLQNTYYGGVIDSYTSQTKYNLYKAGDGLSMAGATYIRPTYTSSYSYTVSQ